MTATSRRDFLRGCGAGVAAASLPVPLASEDILLAQRPLGFTLSDVTAAAGIQFRHTNGAYGGKLLPETLGSGCAFIDYDADGWPDILLVNGMDWPEHRRQERDTRQRSTMKLYKNN